MVRSAVLLYEEVCLEAYFAEYLSDLRGIGSREDASGHKIAKGLFLGQGGLEPVDLDELFLRGSLNVALI